ncbi:MAG: thiamine biosynthesis lipoprotein [Sulfurimonas sp.]|jgi:thiamine biosynthesis lipoprotein|uniref:FAD:protein FMN transferase n=1 Tax=Sulfurimonas sp. TaxID=2022749 RepID=UPI0039E2328B
MRLLTFKFLSLFFISVTFLSAEMFSRTKVAMGTFVTISLEKKHKKYIENAFHLIEDIELSLSSYNSQAIIYQLNKNKMVKLDAYAYEALDLSKKYYCLSNRYFNITIGAITKDLYKFGKVETIPSNVELKKASTNFGGLHFTTKVATLDKALKVDLGGMGKGFAVDKVHEYFQSKQLSKGIIAASGDIRCLDECDIDVADPFSDDVLLSFKTLKANVGISTSGNYNRYVQSKKHNHLINPKMKESQKNFISITLISELPSSDLDAYATAASVMPIKKAYEFLNGHDLAYIIMQSDRKLRFSDNISRYVKDLVIHNGIKK